MVLIDSEKGVLRADEFCEAHLEEVSKPAMKADILKVHDFRYIKNVIDRVQLAEDHGEPLIKYDRDSMVSPDSWKAALLSSGAVVEAVDQVMAGKFKNAFCAIRPPGHHAGVFGKTFKNNECD